jgi:hypothetical protein
VRVNGAWTLMPFHVAVMIAVVVAVTVVVGKATPTCTLPAGAVPTAGASTAGELLVKFTAAPPDGATPFKSTVATGCAPPFTAFGEIEIDFKDGGSTVSCPVALAPFTVAVMVTGVDETTWPACIWNCNHPILPGMVTVAGTGAAFGSELVKLITAPPAGAADDNCTETQVVLPLYKGLAVKPNAIGVAGAELTVKDPLPENLVTAAVVGEESPWNERTRQNF